MNTKVHSSLLLLERVTLVLLLFSIFLFPLLYFSPSLPAFALSDLLLPVMIFVVLYRFGLSPLSSNYIRLLLFFAFYILITMAVNHRLGQVRDHFEVLKIIKLIVAILFFTATFRSIDWMKVLRMIFVLLLIFNVFQYTGLFDFNNIVQPFYSSQIHLEGFGVNSLGQPATRRLMGTFGNPNNNAILFLFFTALFFPARDSSRTDRALFLLAFLGCLFCQSRTGFIALIVISIAGTILFRHSLRMALTHLLVFPALYLFFKFVDALYLGHIFDIRFGGTYLGSMASTEIASENSVQVRLEIWKKLWQMIKQKPLLGYGPNKDFFYDNKMYPESEYVLVAWRYGFIGLGLFVLNLLYLAWKGLTSGRNEGRRMVLFMLVILITAITNVPLNDPNILMMFAAFIGLYFSGCIENNKAQ